ncbi:hypothetical protein S83_050627 [Arachis hypogaea]
MIAGFSINYLDKTKLSLSSSRCANAASILQSFPLLPFTLIEMYCKCGNVDQARYFFDMMPGKNTVTWNEMIHSYAENGYRDEAVSHYKDMITSGEKSDDITFVAVLTGWRFQEVEVILDIMPCKDDPVVWEVVLNSCRTHTNLSLAKRAAEKLFL